MYLIYLGLKRLKNESYNLKDACPGYPLNRNGCEKEKSAQAIYCRACWWVKARRQTLKIKNMKKYTDVISGED
tara:strand:+ start:278 stop:496 length:219 start_codon:yes stop_codon:yes gene_type:complete